MNYQRYFFSALWILIPVAFCFAFCKIFWGLTVNEQNTTEWVSVNDRNGFEFWSLWFVRSQLSKCAYWMQYLCFRCYWGATLTRVCAPEKRAYTNNLYEAKHVLLKAHNFCIHSFFFGNACLACASNNFFPFQPAILFSATFTTSFSLPYSIHQKYTNGTRNQKLIPHSLSIRCSHFFGRLLCSSFLHGFFFWLFVFVPKKNWNSNGRICNKMNQIFVGLWVYFVSFCHGMRSLENDHQHSCCCCCSFLLHIFGIRCQWTALCTYPNVCRRILCRTAFQMIQWMMMLFAIFNYYIFFFSSFPFVSIAFFFRRCFWRSYYKYCDHILFSSRSFTPNE